MSTLVKKYPAISLLVLAMIFGAAPALVVGSLRRQPNLGRFPRVWRRLCSS